MGWETEEVKSLVVISGLVPVGYVIGSIIATCCGFVSGMLPGVGAFIGASIAIVITLGRMLRMLK